MFATIKKIMYFISGKTDTKRKLAWEIDDLKIFIAPIGEG